MCVTEVIHINVESSYEYGLKTTRLIHNNDRLGLGLSKEEGDETDSVY